MSVCIGMMFWFRDSTEDNCLLQAGTGTAKKAPAKTMLLPMQRSNNVAVFLSRLKMPPAQVAEQSTGLCLLDICLLLRLVRMKIFPVESTKNGILHWTCPCLY